MIKISIIILFLFLILFLYKFLFRKNNSNRISENNNIDYVPIFKLNKDEFKNLTLSEKIELSWKFLYEITEKVLNSFSKEDIDELQQVGSTLLIHGVKYEHVVEYGLTSYSATHTKALEETKATQIISK
jgi:hypothetical protein